MSAKVADNVECQHATVVLPDPLPAHIAAALTVQVDEPRGVHTTRVLDRLGWALLVCQLTDREYTWTADATCAAFRLHPTIAAVERQIPGRACKSARALSVLDLPKLTQVGLAERVAIMFAGDLAWSDDGFRLWSGARWAVDEQGALSASCVKTVVRELLPRELASVARYAADLAKRPAPADKAAKDQQDAENEKAAKAAAALAAFTAKSASSAAVHAALDLIRDEPGVHVPAEVWDSDERLLTVANGTLELADGGAKLREHRRADRITRTARAAWRPDQPRGEFAAFVERAIPDAAVRAYLQRIMGYGLLGHNARRVLLLLVGATSSGKSTLLEAIAWALGDYASSFKLSLFRSESDPGKPRPDLHRALPRRLLITTETSARWALDADAVKRLTGNDTDAARTLHSGTYREQRPAFMPVIACNDAPQIRGADRALWRRSHAVPMDNTVAESAEDPGLGARLRDDADGVLGWLVEGYNAYVQLDGFGDVPQACVAALAAVKADMSLIDRGSPTAARSAPSTPRPSTTSPATGGSGVPRTGSPPRTRSTRSRWARS